jgi:integrase
LLTARAELERELLDHRHDNGDEYAREHATLQQYAMLGLLFDSGFRVSELLGLRWGDLDKAPQKMVLVRQLVVPMRTVGDKLAEPEYGPLKASEYREIRLDRETIAALEWHLTKQKEIIMANRKAWYRASDAEADRLMFSRQEGEGDQTYPLGAPLTRRTVAELLKRIGKAAGVRVIKPHGARHSCAHIMLAAGEPLNRVAKHLGDTEKTVSTFYSHVLEADEVAAADTRGSLLYGWR